MSDSHRPQKSSCPFINSIILAFLLFPDCLLINYSSFLPLQQKLPPAFQAFLRCLQEDNPVGNCNNSDCFLVKFYLNELSTLHIYFHLGTMFTSSHMQLLVHESDLFQPDEDLFPFVRHFQHKINYPLGKIQLLIST